MTDDVLEARLRARLHHYGEALERAVADGDLLVAGGPRLPVDREHRRPAPNGRPSGLLLAAAVVAVAALAVGVVRLVDDRTDRDATTAAPGPVASRWIQAGAATFDGEPPATAPPTGGRSIGVDQVPGGAALGEALAPARFVGASILPGGVTTAAYRADGLTVSVTIQRLTEPVRLPVTEDELARGFQALDAGAEMFVGAVDDEATLGVVVEADGSSATLSVDAPPDEVAGALGDPVAVLLAVRDAVTGR